MFVNPYTNSALQAYAEQPALRGKKSGATDKAAGRTAGADEVVLSKEARSFAQMLQQARQSSDVRPEVIAPIREQIASGSYQVDSRAIASKMLEFK